MHSFDLVANANYAEKTSITGVAANAVSVDLSMAIPAYPASGKFLDPWGIRKSNGSLGFEASNAGTFYLNYEQNSPDTVITYTEDIIWSDGRTSFQRIIAIFTTSSQKVWIRSGGTSNLILNLTKALAFTATRMLFGCDSAFLSDMGGTVRFDKVFVSKAAETQATMETQSDSRTLTASTNCYFFNDCTGATSFVTDGGPGGNNFTQTGSTGDNGTDSWAVAASPTRPLLQGSAAAWWDVPDAPRRRPGIAAFTASPQQFDTVLRPLRPQGLAQAMWAEPEALPQRHVGIAAVIAAPSTVLTGCRAATAAIAWWSMWGAWSLQAQRQPQIAAVTAPPAVAADSVTVTRDTAALSLWDGDSPWPQRRRLVVPVSNPPATDFVPQAPDRRTLWEDPVVPQAPRRPTAAIAAVANRFPLRVVSGGRYTIDVNGVPFPRLGRASWNVLQETKDRIGSYLDDCVRLGFTAVEMRFISSDGTTTGAVAATRAPFANNNTLLPFTNVLGGGAWDGSMPPTDFSSYPSNNAIPDFTTPDTSAGGYWEFVDDFMNAALQRGLLVHAFPAYVGFKNTNQGWMTEMVANGVSRMTTYGAFIANRYKNFPNIVWMFGGDSGTGSDTFTTAQRDVEQALIDGMASVGGQQSVLCSAEWNSPAIYGDQVDISTPAPYVPLSGAYDFGGNIATTGRRAFADSPARAPFALEYPYDEEGSDGTNVNAAATQPVRRFTYWGWLSTIGGYVTGNGFVWPFDFGTGNGDWPDHLNTVGAQDLGRLNAFIKSIQWWLLTPSGLGGMRSLIPSGGGTGPSDAAYVAAAQTADGKLLIAYCPPAAAGTFTVDLRSMLDLSRARWLNPTTGAYTTNVSADGTNSLRNTASAQSFTTPGNNGTGATDWLLVIDAVDAPIPRRPGASLAALALWAPDPQAPLISYRRFLPTSNPPSADIVLRVLDRPELWPEIQLQPQRRPGIAAVIATAAPDTVLRPIQQQAALALLWSDSGLVPQPRRLLVLDAPADTVLRTPPQEQALALWTDPPLPLQRPLPIAAFTASVDTVLRPPRPASLWQEPEARIQRPPGIAAFTPSLDSFPQPVRRPVDWQESEIRAQRQPGVAAILAVTVTADMVPRPAVPAEQTTTAEDLAVPPIRRPAVAAITAPAAVTPDTVINGRTGYEAALTWWQPDPLPAAPRRNLVVDNAPTADTVLRPASRWLALQLIWTPEALTAQRTPGVAATVAVATPESVLRPLSQAAAQALWNVATFAPQRQVSIAAIADQPTPADAVLSTRRRTDLAALAWWSEPALAPAPRRTLTPDSVDTVLAPRNTAAVGALWVSDAPLTQPRRLLVPGPAPATDQPRTAYQITLQALWADQATWSQQRATVASTTPSVDTVLRSPPRPPECPTPDVAPGPSKPTAAITAPPPLPPDSVFTGLGRSNAVLALWWTDAPLPQPRRVPAILRFVAVPRSFVGAGTVTKIQSLAPAPLTDEDD